ncbi:RNA ligase partner protein [Candidatus Woesearchaeota archaeon]|nr:RNA ligase partner protein [Candidatus Woesearchaeota archaeon]
MVFHKIFGNKAGGNVYVLDTSMFVNPDARKYLGQTVHDAVVSFLAMAAKAKWARFYMTPSVLKELKYFAEKELPSFKNTITVKAPSLYELKIPAIVMYKFIDELRTRVNAGLRISEKFVRDDKTPIDEKLHKLRVQYKESLREGILDSEEDFEVLMLAKEMNATIITLDQGLVRAAEELGVKCMALDAFYGHIKET